MTNSWLTRNVSPEDRDAWRRLFSAYCDFYGRQTSAEHLDRVWSWIHDSRDIFAIVAVPGEGAGEPVAIAHLRPWISPLRGETVGFLDDLFVDPSVRGDGAFEAMFEAIRQKAQEQGWSLVRWITAEDNYRARAAYDRVSSRTSWVTYDLRLGD